MKSFGQVLVIAICIFAASGFNLNSAVNNIEQDAENIANAAKKAAEASLNAAKNITANIVNKVHGLIDHSNTGSATTDKCYATYSTELSSVNDAAVSQSQACYLDSTSSVDAYTQNIKSSLAEVIDLSQTLQNEFAACSANTAISDINSCYVSTDLNKLNELTVQAQLAVAYLNGQQSQLKIAQSGCLATVTTASKANSTLALNTLNSCLDSANSQSKPASRSSSGSSSSPSSGSRSLCCCVPPPINFY